MSVLCHHKSPRSCRGPGVWALLGVDCSGSGRRQADGTSWTFVWSSDARHKKAPASAEVAAVARRRLNSDGGAPDDRSWSAHTSVHPRHARADLVAYTPLPAETGPVWAPDRLSVWPVEGGEYGIDAHYHGNTGIQRVTGQRERLKKVGVVATVKTDPDGGIIRIGPLAHSATWLALEAFLGRPI